MLRETRSILCSYVLAAGITVAAAIVATAAAPTIVAAAHPNNNQQDDDPAAVTSAKAVIAHIGTSHEVLTDRTVSTHHMHRLIMGSCNQLRQLLTISLAADHSVLVNTPLSCSISPNVLSPSGR